MQAHCVVGGLYDAANGGHLQDLKLKSDILIKLFLWYLLK